MGKKLKKILKSTRFIIFIILLMLSLLAIRPSVIDRGIAIRSVTPNSSAELAGITSPKPNVAPMSREIILTINDIPIKELDDYYDIIDESSINSTLFIVTNKNKEGYMVKVLPKYKRIYLNTTHIEKVVEQQILEEEVNGTLINRTVNITKNITVRDYEDILIGKDIGLRVYKAPKSNINLGIDLQGGVRVILKPVNDSVEEFTLETTIENMKRRLNVYGLSDISVRLVKSIEGNYIVAEIPGINEEEVNELIAKQGKFEAKIGNETVFVGGRDITYVCMKDANCARIERCSAVEGGGFSCRFMFSISITSDAAKRFAVATKDLDIISDESGQRYLNKKLQLYLDDTLVDELNIVADLQGQELTEASITGGGYGATANEALKNTRENMKKLQTVLITGSLPIKLEVVNVETLSPTLGEGFIKNIMFIGIVALIGVGAVVYIRYRKLRITIPMMICVIGEVILLLGLATVIKWKLDIAALAGLIIAIGTGLDHQIIIADETLRKESQATTIYGLKEKIKRAFSIILGAFFTTCAAMIPLLMIGANLLKGFAFTTIMGLIIGILITRPTYARIIEILLKE